MFKYFPDLNDLSIAMGKLDKSGGKNHQRLKRAQWMCISVLIFFIDKTLSTLLWLCFTLVFENRSNKIINCSGTSYWKKISYLMLC